MLCKICLKGIKIQLKLWYHKIFRCTRVQVNELWKEVDEFKLLINTYMKDNNIKKIEKA